MDCLRSTFPKHIFNDGVPLEGKDDFSMLPPVLLQAATIQVWQKEETHIHRWSSRWYYNDTYRWLRETLLPHQLYDTELKKNLMEKRFIQHIKDNRTEECFSMIIISHVERRIVVLGSMDGTG